MSVATATTVRARDLAKGDEFTYSHGTQRVEYVREVGTDGRLFEVTTFDTFEGRTRWIDYSGTETVEVTGGPSLGAVQVAAARVEPVKTATQRAREAVRLGKVRSLPASATLVLYALAAAQDEASDEVWVPSVGSVAVGAGLAISTTTGHLRSLRGKGLVRESGVGGWTVA